MERIYQMKVVPDALPEIKPTIDLQVIARSTPTDFLKTKKVFQGVEAGVFLRPKQVSFLFFLSFHLPMPCLITTFWILDFATS
jgi:hypothetical protein